MKNAALNGEDFKISDPDVVLDFIPVEDVANHLRIAVERHDIISYKPFVVNIGTGKGVKLIDFAKSKWNEYMATGKLLTEENNNHGKNIKKFVANTVNLNYLNS